MKVSLSEGATVKLVRLMVGVPVLLVLLTAMPVTLKTLEPVLLTV